MHTDLLLYHSSLQASIIGHFVSCFRNHEPYGKEMKCVVTAMMSKSSMHMALQCYKNLASVGQPTRLLT